VRTCKRANCEVLRPKSGTSHIHLVSVFTSARLIILYIANYKKPHLFSTIRWLFLSLLVSTLTCDDHENVLRLVRIYGQYYHYDSCYSKTMLARRVVSHC